MESTVGSFMHFRDNKGVTGPPWTCAFAEFSLLQTFLDMCHLARDKFCSMLILASLAVSM